MSLDGFTISTVDIESSQLSLPFQQKKEAKKELSTFIVSVLMHLILLAFLLQTALKTSVIKPLKFEHKAIKSYLYKAPTKPVKLHQTEQSANQDVKENVSKTKVVIAPKKITKLSVKKSSLNISTPTIVSENQPPSSRMKVNKATFSSFNQLEKLRKSINQKMIEQELAELQQVRSPSIMHAQQALVPHANTALTDEERYLKNTIKMSNDIAITKHENGTCTITRDQFLGSPVEASTSFFNCGESQYDKNFRAHMKKVRDKLLPKEDH